MLPDLLARAGPLPAAHAQDGEPILPGRIYVAPPDRHLLVEPPGSLRLSSGPRENHFRPAVDPLFRTAALALGPRVIGVVLSGVLSDGTAGLWEVKGLGGITVVQDPGEALYPSMPHSAMDQVPVDHVLPATEMSALLARLAREIHGRAAEENRNTPEGAALLEGGFRTMETTGNKSGGAGDRPGSAAVERDMAARIAGERNEAVSVYVCPDCGGTLWQANAGPVTRFRCHVGHVYGGEGLLESFTEQMERSLWSVVRGLQDKANLTRQLAAGARARRGGAVRRHRGDDRGGHLGQLGAVRKQAIRSVGITET